MDHLFEAYIEKEPEIVFEWNDPETNAQGWAVINSLRNGAAGGGTRMRNGLTRNEVVSLAKVMEIKFSVSGPSIGGAKSGINFDPKDPRKDQVLRRWYKAVFPILKNYYGTGGDLNIDEIKEVIPITEQLGLWHPQEGVVNGHLQYDKGEKVRVLGALRYGVSKIIEDPKYSPTPGKTYAIADMATGWGVAESVRHYYKIFKRSDLVDKRVIIQGWGNVASAAAYYLSQSGAKIVGIIDRDWGLVEQEGLKQSLVTELFLQKNGNKLESEHAIPFEDVDKIIWDTPVDIFIPGAASRLVKRDQVERMMTNGLETISCGANVPFFDDEIFFGPTAKFVDQKVSLIPDFIANCGMARVFAYLMQANPELSDAGVFEDISEVIREALRVVYANDKSGNNISRTSLHYALQKISAGH